MATKANRGTKRVCQSCRSKFYDLARSPIVCPICQTVFEVRSEPVKPAFAAAKAGAPLPDDVVAAVPDGIEIIPLDDVEAAEGADIADIDGDDLVELEDGAADLDAVDDEETFLEEEDDPDADVTGFVGGALEGEEDV